MKHDFIINQKARDEKKKLYALPEFETGVFTLKELFHPLSQQRSADCKVYRLFTQSKYYV